PGSAPGAEGPSHGQNPSLDEGERQEHRRAGRAAHFAHPLPARRSQHHRPAHRLRDQPLRRLHRRSRRQVDQILHRVRGAGERRRHPHHRRHGERGRYLARVARRLPRDARPAMRLLHARHDHAGLPTAAGEQEPVGGRNPYGHFGQPVPLHRLSEHRQGHSIRRRKDQRRGVPGGRRMNDTSLTSAQRAEKLEGMGCKRKRVEDIRFVQGKGNYVDDLKLPGMLYGDFTRSPHGHARVKNIDTTKAAALPGVVAVITAETLKTVNLAWMPTLAGDTQMVLADGKVLFQNQEVAFVIAEDRYTAADAADLVEVEYEALPVNVDPLKAMSDGAPVIREDIKDKTDGAHGKRKHPNHIFSWAAGDKAATDAAFEKPEVTTKTLIAYPRVHPCPLETCQCVASFDKIKGELTLWGTFQAPHVIRTVGSLISKIPEHKIHVIAPDIG